jgi:hypothetical protein
MSEVFPTLKENNFSPRIHYSAKVSFKIEGGIKIFHDKQKNYITIKPSLQKILNGILNTKDANKYRHEMMGNTKPQEKI